ncbi:MAG TPA: hypothetical protein VGC22_01720 [Chitinophaga sp.]
MRTCLLLLTVSLLAAACRKDHTSNPTPWPFPPPKYLKDKLAGNWQLRQTGTLAGPDSIRQSTIWGLLYNPPVLTFLYPAGSTRKDTISLQALDTIESRGIMTLEDGTRYNITFVQKVGLNGLKLVPLPTTPDSPYLFFIHPFLPD